VAAEELCELFHLRFGLPRLILRTSRFFPEADDRKQTREVYADANVKANEFLYRRADIEDIVSAQQLAIERAPALGFGRYIISATTPFTRDDLAELRANAPETLARRVPRYREVYAQRGWSMFPGIDRVYVNERARRELGWQPKYDFAAVLEQIAAGIPPAVCLRGSSDPRAITAKRSPASLIQSIRDSPAASRCRTGVRRWQPARCLSQPCGRPDRHPPVEPRAFVGRRRAGDWRRHGGKCRWHGRDRPARMRGDDAGS
jgi:hypothetical protein